jgi:adenosylhomocysteinase
MVRAASATRDRYLHTVVASLPKRPCQVVVVTHLLPDRPALLRAMASLATIARVLPIPYSTNEDALHTAISEGFPVTELTWEQLNSRAVLQNILRDAAESTDVPIIICEIGGYFAGLLPRLPSEISKRVLGVVEDTEAGHRRYLEVECDLQHAVLSLARDRLKDPEDRLVGTSVVYSVENLLRRRGAVLTGLRATVLGYGKIGHGAAVAASERGLNVGVWDPDPLKRVRALADGFLVPDRTHALSRADLIIGASGRMSLAVEDLPLLRDGAVLASASSKQAEFEPLIQLVEHSSQCEELTAIPRQRQGAVFLLDQGRPVNFLHDAVIGPALTLVQAGLLAGIAAMAQGQLKVGLHELPAEYRTHLAAEWIETYADPISGSLRLIDAV